MLAAMATPSSQNVDPLLTELNRVLPPPSSPPGSNEVVIPGTGRWVAVRVGAGQLAVRIEYQLPNGGQMIVRSTTEVRGYPSAVVNALRFTLHAAAPGRYEWVAV